MIEYDKVSNARGYRGWEANWRTGLELTAFTGIQTLASTAGAIRGAGWDHRLRHTAVFSEVSLEP